MGDGEMAVRGMIVDEATEFAELAGSLHDLDMIALEVGDSGAVVASVFKSAELIENDVYSLFRPHVSGDATHV
jgi:hypothetical protein